MPSKDVYLCCSEKCLTVPLDSLCIAAGWWDFYFLTYTGKVKSLKLVFFSGILGAPPSVPLLTNPALSTALLQLALQNQTQAQQVVVMDRICFSLSKDSHCLWAALYILSLSSSNWQVIHPLLVLKVYQLHTAWQGYNYCWKQVCFGCTHG